jgi:hypothetical protein
MIGARRRGKTTKTRKMLKNAPRVLYVLTTDHEAYRDLRPILPSQLKVWTSEKKGHLRIICNKLPGNTIRDAFAAITTDLWNAKVVFEDATKFVGSNLTEDQRDSIIDCRQKGNDLIFQFHTYQRIAPELFDNADWITIFKNRGKYKYDKVPDYLYDIIERVRNYPEKKYEDRFYCETHELD